VDSAEVAVLAGVLAAVLAVISVTVVAAVEGTLAAPALQIDATGRSIPLSSRCGDSRL